MDHRVKPGGDEEREDGFGRLGRILRGPLRGHLRMTGSSSGAGDLPASIPDATVVDLRRGCTASTSFINWLRKVSPDMGGGCGIVCT